MAIDPRPVIERTLRAALHLVPVDAIDIASGRDHADEEALFIVVELPPSTPLVGGEKYLAAMTGVSDALLKLGDSRFPYIRLDHVEEQDAQEFDGVKALMP